jgi:hypothetical protein
LGGNFASKARHGGSRRGYRQPAAHGRLQFLELKQRQRERRHRQRDQLAHGLLRCRRRRHECAGRGGQEGTLNVITLPANWANYGTIMKDFTARYGIKINDANPDGSSQDELNAVNQLKGQDRAPDVLDMGTAFAVKGAQQGNLAPYKVATWASIPPRRTSCTPTRPPRSWPSSSA